MAFKRSGVRSSLAPPIRKRRVLRPSFFVGKDKNLDRTPRGEFDKEEQARRKYRRTCDDAAAERSDVKLLSSTNQKKTGFTPVFFCW